MADSRTSLSEIPACETGSVEVSQSGSGFKTTVTPSNKRRDSRKASPCRCRVKVKGRQVGRVQHVRRHVHRRICETECDDGHFVTAHQGTWVVQALRPCTFERCHAGLPSHYIAESISQQAPSGSGRKCATTAAGRKSVPAVRSTKR
jgi:hypothetical protein